MRSYLERLAASAIAPGGSFHPLPGSIYAPRQEAPSPPDSVFVEAPSARKLQIASYPDSPEPLLDPQPQASRPAERAAPIPSTLADPPPTETFSTQFPYSQAPRPGDPPHSPAHDLPQSETPPNTSQPVSPTRSAAFEQADAPTPAPYRIQNEANDSRPTSQSPAARTQPRTSSTPSTAGNAAEATQPPSLSPEPENRSPFAGEHKAASHSRQHPSRKHAISAKLELAAEAPSSSVAPPEAPFATAATSPVAKQQPTPEPIAYRPLVATNTPPRAQSNPVPTPSAPGGPSPIPRAPSTREPIRARNLSAQREQLQQRQADEIQIHIGRIEVTAVAPAPAAPTQPTAIRRTPSLDDYLRRGNGRA